MQALGKTTVKELATANAFSVAIVDATGAQITSFGGGTQYTEDDAAAANPVGTAQILVRQDTPAALVTTDGDNVARRGTNYGAAFTQIVSSTGAFVDTFGGGTQYTEDAASAADPIGTMGMMVRADSLAAVTSTDGDNIAFRGTNKGELYVKHVDNVPVVGTLTHNNAAPGAINIGALTVLANASTPTFIEGDLTLLSTDLSGRIRVQGTGATGSAVPGVAVYNAGLNESGNLEGIRTLGATTNTTTGIFASGMAAVFDDVTPTSIIENQFGALRMSANRNLYGTIRDAAGNERGVNVTAGNALVVDGSGVTQPVSGTVTAASPITGISDGRKVVATAGTRVTLAASTACKRVTIVAETDNTGLIVVGGTTVVATLATRQGVPLNPGDAYEMDIDNLNDVNLDSEVSGDGVTFSYFT